MKRLPLILLLLVVVASAYGKKTKTTHSGRLQRAEQVVVKPEDAVPAIIPDSGDIVLAGYDKPLRTRRETILATNHRLDTVDSLFITIRYLDTDGRQLHERSVKVGQTIPAGETRQLQFPTWDIQQSYYYYLSTPPRAGIPYRILARVDSLK
ncbi:MAG: FxLYD domain-containing protein [Bacteroidales bacterium]|nr:FxLYD domain-containing protein [Bacteroidales bacterium]MCD8393610.1 FxLYD domain-containing protein [Bacteroidales bacterium]